MSTYWAIVFLTSFMLLYALYMQIASKHQKRKLRKNPIVYNEDFAPFVSIMVPAHNEASVIEGTIENILKLDYENYEITDVDERLSQEDKELAIPQCSNIDLSTLNNICKIFSLCNTCKEAFDYINEFFKQKKASINNLN